MNGINNENSRENEVFSSIKNENKYKGEEA